MSIQFRKPTLDDIDLCLALEMKDIYGRATAIDKPHMRAAINGSLILLAEDADAQAIGYVRTDFLWASRMPFTTWWYVDPEAREHGVGTRLLAATRRALEKAGFDRWLISSCRPEIIDIFERTGWQHMGQLRLSDVEQEHWFVQDL
jgi:GNAT superfamily N-acetyltransferase